MYYVYVIQSLVSPDQIYIGYTCNLKARFKAHNAGSTCHTALYRPWKLISYIGLDTKIKATELEKYLKSHSGRVFIKKRLL